jgi:hypothetical protein
MDTNLDMYVFSNHPVITSGRDMNWKHHVFRIEEGEPKIASRFSCITERASAETMTLLLADTSSKSRNTGGSLLESSKLRQTRASAGKGHLVEQGREADN